MINLNLIKVYTVSIVQYNMNLDIKQSPIFEEKIYVYNLKLINIIYYIKI